MSGLGTIFGALRARLRQAAGFTLMEMVVAMAVFLLFMSFATPFLFSQLEQAVQTESRVDLQQHARVGMRSLVRELRQARELYSTSDKPSGKNNISFGVDLDASGSIDSSEQVTYYIKGSKLYRDAESLSEAGQPITENTKSITFTMFGTDLERDDDGNGIVDETELQLDSNVNNWTSAELQMVTRIDVSLVVSEGTYQQTYGASVYLRNKVVG